LQFLNHIPLLRFLIPFVIGIITAVYLKTENLFILISLAFSFLIYLGFLFLNKFNSSYKYRWIFGILIYINFLLAGYSLTIIYHSINGKSHISQSIDKKDNQLIIGKIIKPPQVKEKTVKVILKIKGIKTDKSWIESNGKVIVYLQKDNKSSLLQINDILSFEPKLKNVPAPKNPNEFDYRKYLSYHLIHQQAFLESNDWNLIQKPSNKGIYKIADETRSYLINTLEKKGLKGKELGVASALILGYKDDIDSQLKSAYSSAGAMHVLAVSGLHVGVIFLVFNFLLKFMEKIKYGIFIKGVLLIFLLWSYALLTGLSPSVMRAATMFSFIVAAKTINRNSNIYNTLAASAFILLFFNPLLIMEVGFQLSYLAVIGIVTIQPWIYNWFKSRYWIVDKVWEITAISLAVQIATAPLSILYFHQFPNYFMLSNLVVIPLAIVILYLGLITLTFSFVPIISEYLALTLKYIISLLNWSVSFIDSIPYSLTENIRFNVIDSWLIYGAIIFIILLVYFRTFKAFLVSTLCIISFLFLNLIITYNNLNQKKLIIYNIPSYSAINFIDGKDNILMVDLELIQNRSRLMFHVQNNWINNGLNNEKIIDLNHLVKKYQLSNNYKISNPNIFTKQNYLQFYNYKIVIVDHSFILTETQEKLSIDCLIIRENLKCNLKDLLALYNPKEIIIDTSNSLYVSEKLQNEAQKLGVKCWAVLIDGAYIKTF